jgi:DNA-binding transcriptional ArsR family regulator
MSLEVGPDRGPGKPETASLRALAHPLRLQMLSLLTGATLSAAEVARELNLNHANASYHLRQLHSAGLIELAGEEQIRGGHAKRYRYIVGRGKPSTGGDPAPFYAVLATELRRRAGLIRAPQGNHATDAELWVDPQVWTDVRDRITTASRDLHLAAHPPRTPGTIRVSATIALFEMDPT